ncbi:MAG: translocation/assembly module TamB domain-containing protein [Pseudomonadota bacterium]|nr:translocation/assembly module TamB domain-containing protein [Pseudomonadota bacterium]
MIRRAFIGLFALITLALLLAGLLLYGLAGTATGNRWLLTQVSDLIPGELSVEHWDGNLLGTVSLRGLVYENDSLSVTLNQLDAQLHPLTLTRGWLTFDDLSLGHLLIKTTPGPAEESNSTSLPDSLTLPLGIRIEHLSVDSVTVNDTQLAQTLEGESLSAWRRFQLARLEATLLDDLDVNLSAHGQLASPYNLDGRLRWRKPLPDKGAVAAAQTSGELVARGPLTALQLNHDLYSPVTLHSAGHWRYQDQQWQVDLKHQWQQQPLPLSNDPGLTLDAGTLITRGPLSAIQLKGKTALTRTVADQQPQTLDIELDAQLAEQTLTLATLTLQQSGQQLSASGTLQLQPLQWDLALNGALDTGMLVPTLPGQLTIDGHSQGQIKDNHWQLEPGSLQVTGTLRQQPLSLHARTRGHADNLQIDSQLHWGDNQLTLAGKAWPEWQLEGELALANLTQLERSLQGRLTGNLSIQGPPQRPRFSGTLAGNALRQGELQLDAVQANFSNVGTGPQQQAVKVSAAGLQQNGRGLLDRLTLDLQGTLPDHQLTLALTQEDTRLDTQLEGTLSLNDNTPPRWEGALQNTRLEQAHLGQWTQQAASALFLSASRQQLGELCLQQQQSQLCAQGSLNDAQQFTLDANMNALPLALLTPLIGPDHTLKGTLQGETRLKGTLEAPTGDLKLQTRDARLSFNVEDGPAPWQLDTVSLESRLDGQQAHTRFVLSTALGQVNAEIDHGFTPDAAMQGQVAFRIERLSVVEMLTADLRDVSGKLHGDIQLAGTPRAPIIEGTIALQDGHTLVPALGTAFSDINLRLTGSPKGRLAVDGQARMGTGTLKVTGYLDPSRWPLALKLQFSGQRLLVAERPDAQVWVSPDLTLSGDLEGMMLSGELRIPEAAIRPEQLPEGAITVSEDQVLVHQEGNKDQALPLGMDVTVRLGDQVSFNGFGLNATLGGTLQIAQQPRQPPQLNGELIVVEGRYRAYGQNLAISDGQLIFQGQPDNPGLDIRAYRKIPSEAITVGVQLGGTLQTPEATLYSDPAMETSQIMSYLLTGRPLEGGTQSDANRIAQALAVYGLEKGSGVTQKIGDKLGVDEITVGSDWETEDAALMLGKQLSERLYLTYAIGLFDAVSTVMLRYTLSRSLHLEARSSSEANSLDLIWEKELR